MVLCLLVMGCSRKDTADERVNTGSQRDVVQQENVSLETWIGEYGFSEFAPPDQNMFYSLSIYKKDRSYYADLSIDGFQTTERLRAKVAGDGDIIQLIFMEYLPDNLYEPYSEGDILLSLERKDSQIYTQWGKIEPMLEENKSGKVCFGIEAE